MRHFLSPSEVQLNEERKHFLSAVNPEDIADGFPLFINRIDLAKYMVKYELFKKILNVKGSIVECGVYKGGSLMLFAKLSAAYEPYNYTREVIGFDIFTGHPKIDDKDGTLLKVNDLSDVKLEILEKSIELYDRNRPIGHLPKVKLVKGNALQTIPEFFTKHPYVIVAMLYIDFDLYESTKIAIKTILPRMTKGAILAFGGVGEQMPRGETAALLEELDINKYEIKSFPEEPHISYIKL